MQNVLLSISRPALRKPAKGLMVGLAAYALLAALAPAPAAPIATSNPRVTIVIEKRGTITVELLQTDAPKTVAHFLDLVRKKFYDGILFHRVVTDFVAQAGDPKSKKMDGAKIADMPWEEVGEKYGLGNGGSGKDGGDGETVPLEAKASHARGTLGLARSQDPNSGDCQFFFNLKPNLRLDSGYCVFGKIVDKKGLEVMDKIKQGDRIKSIRIVGGEKSENEKSEK